MKRTMNFADLEFVDQCIKHSTDPTVLRLCKILDKYEEVFHGIRTYVDLDENLRVTKFYQEQDLCDYVEEILRENVDQLHEISELEKDVSDLQNKVVALEGRTLVEIATQFQTTWTHEKKSLESRVRTLQKTTDDAVAAAAHAKGKLDTWTILSTENLN